MPADHRSEPGSLPGDYLFTLRFSGAAAPEHVFDTPWGARRAARLDSGSFAGPRLSGTIASGLANDWGSVSASGTTGFDAEVVLRTDGGEAILMAFHGRQGDDGKARIAPLFEASDGPNAWLSERMTVGVGGRDGDDLVLDIYAIA